MTKKQHWLLNPIFRTGQYFIVTASPQTGKTHIIMQWMAAWESGQSFLGYSADPVPWVYIALDKPADGIEEDFLDSGLDPSQHDWVSLGTEPDVSWQMLTNEAIVQPKHRLVVIEAFTSFCTKPNDYIAMRRVLAPFGGWLAETQRAALVSVHERKYINADEVDPLQRSFGSTILPGMACSGTLSLWRDDKNDDTHRAIAIMPRRDRRRDLGAHFTSSGTLEFEDRPQNLSDGKWAMLQTLPDNFSREQAAEANPLTTRRTLNRWLSEMVESRHLSTSSSNSFQKSPINH